MELQRTLAPLPPMGFAAVVEAATRTEMADQAVTQRKVAIGSVATPCGRGPWKSRDSKRPLGEQMIRNEGWQTLISGGVIRYVRTSNEVDMWQKYVTRSQDCVTDVGNQDMLGMPGDATNTTGDIQEN